MKKKNKRTYIDIDVEQNNGYREKLIVFNGKETRYSIRNDGTVFSNNYRNSHKRHKMAKHKDSSGYIGTHVMIDGKSYMWLNHQLVAEAFLTRKKKNENLEVNHINGDKTDNRDVNLEYCTRLENMTHAIQNDLRTYKQGELHYNANITNKDVKKVCKLLEKDEKIINIEKITGVPYDTICSILYGKEWKEISKNYNFTHRSNHHRKKLTEKDVHEICKLYNTTDMTMSKIAKKFNISKTAVNLIIKGKNWKHISCQYTNNRKK